MFSNQIGVMFLKVLGWNIISGKSQEIKISKIPKIRVDFINRTCLNCQSADAVSRISLHLLLTWQSRRKAVNK